MHDEVDVVVGGVMTIHGQLQLARRLVEHQRHRLAAGVPGHANLKLVVVAGGLNAEHQTGRFVLLRRVGNRVAHGLDGEGVLLPRVQVDAVDLQHIAGAKQADRTWRGRGQRRAVNRHRQVSAAREAVQRLGARTTAGAVN